jgi:hypothetical protein
MTGEVWLALGAAALATHSWRVLAALVGPHLARSRRATAAVDGTACALVSGVVADMVLDAGGALGAAPTAIRVAALAVAVAAYFACRRSVAAGVSVGFAALTAGAALS